MLKALFSALKILFVVYFSIGMLIWISSPWIVNYFLSPVLAERDLSLSEQSSIRYNPFITALEVKDLALIQASDIKGDAGLTLDNAYVEASLWQLLFDKAYVSEVTLSGLAVKVIKSEQGLSVAGVIVQDSNTDEAKPSEQPENTEDEGSKQTAKANPYQLILDKVQLSQSAIAINWLGHQHNLAIDEFILSDVLLSEKTQQGSLVLALKLNEQPINLSSDFALQDAKGAADVSLDVDKVDLAKFNHFIFASNEGNADSANKADKLNAGTISVGLKQTVELSQTSLSLDISDFNLSLDNLDMLTAGVSTTLAKKQILAEDFKVSLDLTGQNSLIQTLEGEVSLALNNIHAFVEGEDASAKNTLAKISALQSEKIAISLQDNIPFVSMDSLEVNQAEFSDDVTDELAPLARFKQLKIVNTKVSSAGLSVDTLDIEGLAVDAIRAKDNRILGLVLPKTAAKTEQESEQTTDELADAEKDAQLAKQAKIADAIEERKALDSDEKFPMAIKEIRLVGESVINFTDQAVEPAYHRHFDIETLSFGPIDNQQEELVSQLKLKGTSNNFSHFNFNADMTLFKEAPYYKLSGAFKEVSLPKVSTYVKNALQYEFEAGQLDLALDIEVNDTAIDGNTNIFLRGVEFAAANNPEDEVAADSTTIPFNLALGMLKDSDGNVELDVPLHGSTDAPDFSLSGFATLLVKRATMLAAKEYLITTFVPYANVVKIGLSASDYLLKISINDLPYQVGQTELADSATPFLTEFSKLMKEKADRDVTICAFSVPEDIGIGIGESELSQEQVKALEEISVARMQAFKNYMVKEQGIASSRLLICLPKIDTSSGAKPRLTFAD